VDWKRLVQFALLGSSDLEQMPSCWYAFRSGCSSPSPGQTKLFVAGGTKTIYETLVKAKVPFPHQMAYFVSRIGSREVLGNHR
jgi:putative oxidoreductase